MKLTGSRVGKFLESPPHDIIGVLFFGPDRGLAKEQAANLMSKWITNPDDAFATTVLTADDLSSDPAKLSDEMSSMSLLGDQRIIRLRLDHERQAAMISKLIKSIDANPKSAEAKLIIEAGDLSTRSAVRKTFEAGKHFVSIGCYAANTADLANLVRTELNAQSISIDKDALDMWIPLLDGDRALVKNEIEKMALFKGYGTDPGAIVTVADIRQVAAGGQSVSIDDIIDEALNGNPDSCDSQYKRAIDGKIYPADILRALQRHLNRLLEANAHMSAGETPEGAMKSLRPPVFRMKERVFLGQLNTWPARLLRRALAQSLEAEKQLKSAGAPGEAITGRLLLALAGYASKRKRR